MKSILSAVVGATLALSAIEANAQATPGERQVALTIETGTLANALDKWAQQSGFQIFVQDWEAAKKLPARSLKGTFAAQDALEQLLSGTPLTYVWISDKAVSIRKKMPQTVPTALQRTGFELQQSIPVAKFTGDDVAMSAAVPSGSEGSRVQGSSRIEQVEEVIVTGTYIRGAPTASPVQVYGSEEIARSGLPTVQQFLRTVPQNFGGGASELASAAQSDQSQSNIAGENAANLRGLGPGATLTLVNGRRMAAAGTGAYVDLSLIPMSAIDRIEVVTDGASALYGSDAVAGVVNFVLMDDYQGAETLLDYGVATEGTYSSTRVSQLLGTGWDSGNVLLSYDHTEQSNLSGEDRSFTPAVTAAIDLTPRTKRNSAFVAVNQSVTDSLDLSASAIYADGEAHATNVLQASSDNDSQNAYGSVALTYRFSPKWSIDIAADRGEYQIKQFGTFLGFVAFDSIANTTETATDAVLRGDLASLPAGLLQVAIGGGYRKEGYQGRVGSTGLVTTDEDRNVTSAFAEINVPLFSHLNRRTLLEELTISLAARREHYSDFGNSTDPKYGIRWRPHPNLLLRATTGESFKAPILPLLGTGAQALVFPLADPQNPSGDPTTSLILLGARADLEPETAKSKTFGLDYTFTTHAKLSFTWFDTKYTQRIQSPASTFVTMLVDEQSVADFVLRNPSAAQVDEAINSSQDLINPFGLPVSSIGAIVDDRVQNVASLEVSGFDVDARYAFSAVGGEISTAIGAQYLSKYEQRATSTSSAVDLADTLFNPPKLRLRGVVGWGNDRAALSLAFNHTDQYVNNAVVPVGQVDALTTVDLHASYTFEAPGARWLDGIQLAVNVIDVFDSSPSEAEGTLAGYDAMNASPLGRVVSAQVRKRW